MSINSREKGKRGELEICKIMKEYGFDCHRSVQDCGANGDADVIGLPGIHMEIKRVEALNIDKAMKQSISDARTGEIPTVFHRKNEQDWKVTMLLDDWVHLFKAVIGCQIES